MIEHSRFKNAVVHLANRFQKKYPNDRYWLIKARLGGNGWTIATSQKTDVPMDIQELPPPVVNFDDLTDEDHDSLENIVIDTDNISRSLEIADNFARTVDNLVRIRLFSLLKLVDSWQIIYFAKNTEDKDVVISLRVNADGTIVSEEIEVFPPNNKFKKA
jgi:hypothetical protein